MTMTAPSGNAANVYTGMREFGQVTDSYGGYYKKGAGTGATIPLPFIPDRFDLFNYTKFGTASQNIQSYYFRDFAAGAGLLIGANATPALVGTLATTNAFTDTSTIGGFADEHLVIGAPGIVAGVITTTAPHGLTTGDRVVLTQIVGTVASQLNNNTYVVVVLSSTTFQLYDTYGFPIVQVGSWTSGGQVTKTGPDYFIQNSPPVYQIFLGTSIAGNTNDVLYFTAWKFNNYVNLGTLLA